jgi:hypothetical protein
VHGIPEDRAGIDGINRMGLEQEAGDNAEVPASAANRPEQIGMLTPACGDESSIGEHDIGLEQVINRQAVLAGQITRAATEREPADARR